MEPVLETLHNSRIYFAEYALVLCDFIGIFILLLTVVKSFVKYFQRYKRTKIELAKGIALALEFKLAGEVLRSVTVRTWSELAILGTIVALRAAIALLIHWEIRTEKSQRLSESAETPNSDESDNVDKIKIKINS